MLSKGCQNPGGFSGTHRREIFLTHDVLLQPVSVEDVKVIHFTAGVSTQTNCGRFYESQCSVSGNVEAKGPQKDRQKNVQSTHRNVLYGHFG